MREEFEKWAVSQGHNCALSTRRPGEYLYTGLQRAWEAWQAATAHQEAKVRELEESRDAWRLYCQGLEVQREQLIRATARVSA